MSCIAEYCKRNYNKYWRSVAAHNSCAARSTHESIKLKMTGCKVNANLFNPNLTIRAHHTIQTDIIISFSTLLRIHLSLMKISPSSCVCHQLLLLRLNLTFSELFEVVPCAADAVTSLRLPSSACSCHCRLFSRMSRIY